MEKINISVAGSGTVTPGEYGKISTAGSCVILGDITCDEIKTAGSCRSKGKINCHGVIKTAGSFHTDGDIESKEIRSAGSFHADKNVSADILNPSGSAHIEGNANVKSLSVAGSCSIEGDLHAEVVKIGGFCKIGGTCEAENFASYAVNIGGLLNAGNVEIKLCDSTSKVREIGCERLHIRLADDFLIGRFFSFKRRFACLEAETIEADEVDIVNTNVDKISCINARIGSNCKVGRMEYSGNIEISDTAKVGEKIKI